MRRKKFVWPLIGILISVLSILAVTFGEDRGWRIEDGGWRIEKLGPSLDPRSSILHPRSSMPWWQGAVIYEIYPRSFADSNNDGIGDLKGIIQKLDYLHDLGIDAIWLSPCYPSPQVDFGYDVADYETINPEYGSLQDFDTLVAEGKKRGIRITMDLVLNHTSDQHAWFIDSRSSPTAKHRDWYIWRDGKEGQPPNNWTSLFGGSAWTWEPKRQQYYYHFFFAEQPDLNWRNPEVRQAMFDVTRFWLKRGAAGYRLDAITTLFEDPELHDNPNRRRRADGSYEQETKYNNNLPAVHDVLRELRKVIDEFPDAVLIGETGADTVAKLSEYFGRNHDEIQLPMNFFFSYVNKLSAPEFRQQIALWDQNPAGGWPLYLFSNHDAVRHYDRYGDGKHNDQIAKLTAGLLLTLRGTAQLYYGEEIGMQNHDPTRKEDVKDPIGRIFWPETKGRDGCRTPMQWNDQPNAGFCTTKPWLPVHPNYRTKTVAAQQKDPNSLLNWYKKLLALRKQNAALLRGESIALKEDDPHVLAYLRQAKDQVFLVALNLSDAAQTVQFDLGRYGVKAGQAKTVATSLTRKSQQEDLKRLELAPFEVYIGDVTK